MNVRANLKSCLVMAMFLMGMGGTAAAGRTIYVDDDGPADFNNIQAAIDDSNDGDTIIVKPGLYREYVRFYGKNITLTSTNPGDSNVVASTIIEYGVGFAGSEDPNCTLTGFKINGSIYGGANHTHATISYCLLSGNRVYQGTVIKRCDGTISNCVIVDNWPGGDNVSAAIVGCHGLIKNCSIAHNFSGVAVSGGGTTTIENCIIYHNRSVQVGVAREGTVNILYSDVEGGLDGIIDLGNVNWGPGNMDADPCFVRIGPDWVLFEGDYHLQSQAGRWDANSQSWVQDANTSPCIDGGNAISPVGFEPFPNGGIINMGAYGGTAEASKSYFGQPVCETIVAGDINGDCKVDFLDFALMALHWLKDNRPCGVVFTTTYLFQPDPNALRITGGFAGQGQGSCSIEGEFELTVDSNAGTAWFNSVDATFSKKIYLCCNPIDCTDSLDSTDSLDVLFTMTELVSTSVSDMQIDFVFVRNIPAFPGAANTYLTVIFAGDSVHLVGSYCEPVYDGYYYHLDVVAVAE